MLGTPGSVVTGALADITGWPVAYGVVIVLLACALGSLVVTRLCGVTD